MLRAGRGVGKAALRPIESGKRGPNIRWTGVFQTAHMNLSAPDAVEIGPDLGTSWFRPCPSLDAYGRQQPSFDLTQQGFTLLVMGWCRSH